MCWRQSTDDCRRIFREVVMFQPVTQTTSQGLGKQHCTPSWNGARSDLSPQFPLKLCCSVFNRNKEDQVWGRQITHSFFFPSSASWEQWRFSHSGHTGCLDRAPQEESGPYRLVASSGIKWPAINIRESILDCLVAWKLPKFLEIDLLRLKKVVFPLNVTALNYFVGP